MDRAETAGLGVALVGHGALFALLTLAAQSVRPPQLPTEPIQIMFFEEVGPTSAAPEPTPASPAPSIAPELGPPEAAAPEPVRAIAPPPPRPAVAAPAPRPVQPAAQKPVPTKAQPERATNRNATAQATRGTRFGADFLKGIGSDPSTSRSEAAPAAEIGAAVRSSLSAAVRRQLKPHWKAPTGADAELLRTELSIALARDGSVIRVEVLRTTGQTASNRPQVKLHQEQAIRAVRLAAPFDLPVEYFDSWKLLSPIGFDKRLSQ
jgi:outer membrane biosynthesis protein TonB